MKQGSLMWSGELNLAGLWQGSLSGLVMAKDFLV
jgi:hypothetical protein